MWNWVLQEVTDRDFPSSPREHNKVSLRNLPHIWVGNHHSHCPWTPQNCHKPVMCLPLMYFKVFKVNTPNGSTDCSYQVSVPSSYTGIVCGIVADYSPF